MTYKVIQWATGNVGTYALKATIENPDLELVGVKVYDPAKEGKDAGDLCGMPATGVLATTSLDEILKLDADIVLHSPLGQPTMDEHDADVMALLRSGKNVISVVGYAYPYCHGEEYARKLHDAAVDGGVTLYGGGLSPELILSRIPAALSSMCTDVKQIRLTEIAFMKDDPHKGMMVDTLGMGKKPEDFTFDGPGAQYLFYFVPELLHVLASLLEVKLDPDVKHSMELALATEDIDAAATLVKKGTIAGIKASSKAFVDGDEFLSVTWYWYVEENLPDYPVPTQEYQWRIEIDGSPSISTVCDIIKLDAPHWNFQDDPGYYATAGAIIRAIPLINAAPPGLFQAPVFAPWTPRMPT